jgi:hypothetical protein
MRMLRVIAGSTMSGKNDAESLLRHHARLGNEIRQLMQTP